MRTHAINLLIPSALKFTFFTKQKCMLLVLLSVGTLLLSRPLMAAEANPYAKHYQAQNTSQLKSLSAQPDTKMYLSRHKDEDNISMLEDGYDLMGSSGFSGTDAPVDGALQLGKSIKADTVLVYRKYGSAKTGSAKFDLIKEAAKTGAEIDEKDLLEEPTVYNYYASYWAKLPTPVLGVHVIKLVKVAGGEDDKPQAEPGLKILAVIKGSPAAQAHIIKGDSLLKIGELTLNKPDDLFAAVKRYAGQTVAIELQRNGELIKVNVALNARH